MIILAWRLDGCRHDQRRVSVLVGKERLEKEFWKERASESEKERGRSQERENFENGEEMQGKSSRYLNSQAPSKKETIPGILQVAVEKNAGPGSY